MLKTLPNKPVTLNRKEKGTLNWKQLKIYWLNVVCGPYIDSNSTWKNQKKKSMVFLEGWDGEGDGREVQEGKNICILMADLRWCLAENNTILYSNYPSFKK